MGAIVAAVAGSIIFIVIVVVLSLSTINRGYSYKHTVDAHPDDEVVEDKTKENRK